MSFELHLLGPFEAHVDGQPLPRLRSRKGQWLLALLALHHRREIPRDWLLALLWPDNRETQAAVSLRQSLADLRRALGTQAWRLRSPTIRTLSLDLSGAEVDLLEFESAMTCADPASLELAVSLYRGPLLEGCLEEWIRRDRQRCEQAYLGALEKLSELAMQQGDYPSAVQRLRLLLSVDPLRETAHRAPERGRCPRHDPSPHGC